MHRDRIIRGLNVRRSLIKNLGESWELVNRRSIPMCSRTRKYTRTRDVHVDTAKDRSAHKSFS